ncbi:MAG: DUF432 domain-containing protein [Nitrososphaeraceae archaeon]
MNNKFKRYKINDREQQGTKIDFDNYTLYFKRHEHSLLYEKRIESNVLKRILLKPYEIRSDEIGIFPILNRNIGTLYLNYILIKFKTEVIVPKNANIIIYATIPIDIGIFSYQKHDETLIDNICLNKIKFTLYGKPEKGIICRYKEAEINEERLTKKYEEALVKIIIKNNLENSTIVNKIVIPVDDIMIDYENDDCFIPGNIEFELNSLFGKNIATVHLRSTRVKGRKYLNMNYNIPKFTMEWGY